MYQYTDFDRQFVRQRAAQYRDQLERNLRGELKDDEFRPLRLQNGWYVQRYAPMLRVAVPYGELASRQLRVLAQIAREYDQPSAAVYQHASEHARPSLARRTCRWVTATSARARTCSSTGFRWTKAPT